MGKIPEHCPSCQNRLVITELVCPVCGTEVTGQFEPNLFSRLSADDLNFVILFVQTKGNIKEMERELGISYWTIRRKLDEIVGFLFAAGEASDEDRSMRRLQVLNRLRDGDITVEEAAALLEDIKRGG